jgi:hypothetical protein
MAFVRATGWGKHKVVIRDGRSYVHKADAMVGLRDRVEEEVGRLLAVEKDLGEEVVWDCVRSQPSSLVRGGR